MSLKMQLQTMVRAGLRSFGYDICRADERRNPYLDMGRLVPSNPVVFDVGANVGQTIVELQNALLNPTIHAFEPSPKTFAQLKKNLAGRPGLHLNNFALGAKECTLELYENTDSKLSSFLELGPQGWGKIDSHSTVNVRTLDQYCAEQNVSEIDILKIDTQGYDLEVIGGASRLLAQQKINLIFLEIIFLELYKGAPRFDKVFSLLAEQGFKLVAFYKFYYKENRVGWTDALFMRG